MGGGEEGVEEAEEARAILRVEEIAIEEGVESREEVRTVEIVIPDERPETIEAQKCNDALLVDRVLEKIHQKDGVGHMRDDECAMRRVGLYWSWVRGSWRGRGDAIEAKTGCERYSSPGPSSPSPS